MNLSEPMEHRAPHDLRAHSENAIIFGDPEESEAFETLVSSIRNHGILEPLAIKADGTVLSGHLRRSVAIKLGLKKVPVRVVAAFSSYRDELEFVIRCNTDRRQLTKGEIAIAFKRLRETPREQGGAKGKRGRPKKGGASPTFSKTRDDAAKVLGLGSDEARALETVFTTDGVPAELKAAVNTGKVKPTPAAKAIKTEQKRQGGEIKDASALKMLAERQLSQASHEDRMRDEAAAYRKDFADMHRLYGQLDGILSKRPLKSLLGPTEHHEWGGLIRDIALRAWAEIESVQGATNAGKQMKLTVIDGGR